MSNFSFRKILIVWVFMLITLQGCQSVPLCSQVTGEAGEQKDKDFTEKLRQKIVDEKSLHHKAKASASMAVELTQESNNKTFWVFAHEKRNYSGIKLVEGTRYKFILENYSSNWFDKSIDAHPLNGWKGKDDTVFLKAVRFLGRLFSYSWGDDLMVLLGVVEGVDGAELYKFSFAAAHLKNPIEEDGLSWEFISPVTGELYAFANDAKPDFFYENNCGSLMVTLQLLP